MKKCPLVLIEWVDSTQPISAWRHLVEIEKSQPIHCVSVGWLIQDDNGVKVLAPNMGALNEQENLQACGVIRIPVQAVLRVHRLKEPGLRLLE